MFRDAALCASLGASAMVATVMMATLVVGPFHLARGLGLAPEVGLVVSVGPWLLPWPGAAGRATDRFRRPAHHPCRVAGHGAGAFTLAALPPARAFPATQPLVLITAGGALFQTANNTALMAGADPARRGLLSGLLNLSRNLGLVTGASVMGALFMAAAGGGDILAVDPGSVAMATRITFAVAGAGAGGPWVGRLRLRNPAD
jgi:hypothetical protein